jgi:hypothetical protein
MVTDVGGVMSIRGHWGWYQPVKKLIENVFSAK